MKEQLIQAIEKTLPEIDFLASDRLVTDGVVDSLALISLVMALTAEFGVEIPYQEITETNFNSVDAMSAMIERLKGQKA